METIRIDDGTGVILSSYQYYYWLKLLLVSNIKIYPNIMGYSKNECSSIILSGYRAVAHRFCYRTVYHFLIKTLLTVLSKN